MTINTPRPLGVMIRAVMTEPDGANAAADKDFVNWAHQYQQRLFAVAVSILRDPSEAQDAVQDTLTIAWRSWTQVRDEGSRGAWATRICVNHCLRHRSRLSLKWRLGERDTIDVPSRDPTTQTAVQRDIDRAYRRLSPQQRAVIALHYYHGYTLAECSDLMGTKLGTVSSHLGRALQTLRLEISND